MIDSLWLSIAVIILAGVLFTRIAKLIHVPNVTGYLIAGFCIGPAFAGLFGLSQGLISADIVDKLQIVPEMILGFIAFQIGSEFKMSYFKQVGIKPIVIATFESLFAIVFITPVCMLLGCPFSFSLMLGAVGAATAPAATILVLRQYKAKGDFSSTLLSVVAIDDATAMIFFGFSVAIVNAINSTTGASLAMQIAQPFIEVLLSFGIGAVIGFILTFVINFLHSRDNRTSLCVGIVLLSIGLISVLNSTFGVNISALLTTMTVGAIFTNFSKKCEDTMPLIERFTPPLMVMFFVISGADLKLEALSGLGFMIMLAYFFMRIIGKIIGAWFGGKISHAAPVTQKYLGLGLLPQGGVAVGLSIIAMNVLPETIDPVFNGMLIRVVVLCAVFLSELSGPIFTKIALMKSGEGTMPETKKKVVIENK